MRLSLGLLGKKISQFEIMRMLRKSLAHGKVACSCRQLQNIRLSSDVPNPLSEARNWQADGDGCVGAG